MFCMMLPKLRILSRNMEFQNVSRKFLVAHFYDIIMVYYAWHSNQEIIHITIHCTNRLR